MKMRANRSGSVWIIDLLRWFSAFIVVLGHVRTNIFIDHHVAHVGPIAELFYFVSGLGQQAVIVFFVLSGYLVGGTLWLRSSDTLSRSTVADYFIHRFSRIYVVLIPALILTFVLDRIGMTWLNVNNLYDLGKAWSSSIIYSIADQSGPEVMACNALNLQKAFCDTYGSNFPLWSLSYEWFYYVTFPALLCVVKPWHSLPTAAAFTGVVLALAYVAFPPFSGFVAAYPIWLVGVGAGVFVRRHQLPSTVIFGGVVLVAVGLVVGRAYISGSDYVLGLGVALILADRRVISFTGWCPRANAALADFSYSLYATHFPVLVLVVAGLRAAGALPEKLPPGAVGLGLMIVVIAITYVVAWSFAQGTEAQTQRVRRALAGALRARLRRHI